MPIDETPQDHPQYDEHEYTLVRRVALSLKELEMLGVNLSRAIYDAMEMRTEDLDEF
jgi:hypothetical protein